MVKELNFGRIVSGGAPTYIFLSLLYSPLLVQRKLGRGMFGVRRIVRVVETLFLLDLLMIERWRCGETLVMVM